MLCESCKKNQATVFYEEIINGKKRSFALCPECASAMQKESEWEGGGDIFALPSFHDALFGGLFGQTSLAPKKTCPACGASYSDLRQTGKVGCPECYTTFGDELRDTIRSIHGNVKHTGRAPVRTRKDREKQNRILQLKEQMKTAIGEENFELAAKLRDEIRTLEERH